MQYLIYLGELALRVLALGTIGLLATRLLRRRNAEIQHFILVAVLVAMIALPLLMVLLPVVRLLPASTLRNHFSTNAVFPVATPSAAPRKHIAVLPFSVLGSGEGSESLADGLVDTLTSRLSNLEGRDSAMWVVPASEVRRRKVTDAAAAQKEFGATLVVTGTIQRSGQAVRLIVNLIDAKRVRQLGSEEVEDRTGDFAMLQDSAVQKLAKLMHVTVTGDMLRSTGGAVSAAAYESYLKALGLAARWDRPGSLDQAVSLYEKAVKSDPTFALAFAGLGEAYLSKYKTQNDIRSIDQAAAACQHAVRINDQLAPVYVTLGRIHVEKALIDLALQEFQRALQMDPRNPDALFGLATVYEKQARIKEAEEIFLRATALRPDYWDGFTRLGLFYVRQGRFDEATVRLRKVVELTPDNSRGWHNLAAALALQSTFKLDEAVDALQRSIQISPSYPAYANLGNVYYQRQRYADAAQQYEKAGALNDKDLTVHASPMIAFRVWHNLGNAYMWLNETDKAKAAYSRAVPLLEQAVKLSPQDATLQATLGVLYAKVQDRVNAQARLDAARALGPKDFDFFARTSEAYEVLGERKKAVEWLNQAVAGGYSMTSLKNDAILHKLIDDPNFHGNAVFPVATPSAAPSGPRSEHEGSLTAAPHPRVRYFPGWPMLLLAGYIVATGYRLLLSARAVGKASRMVARCAPIAAAPPNALLCDLAAVHAMAYPLPELLESPEEIVPFVAGWRDPVIVLPASWRKWDEFKIGSVLAHELAHVRRNDLRTALLASLNRAIYWYHPVAWWLERQLRRVAEEACDAAAIRSMHDTHRYAAVVLEFAVSVQPGLEWPATGMARSSKVGGRIDRILDERAVWRIVASRGERLRILLVLFPLLYAATALQLRGTDPISHRMVATSLAAQDPVDVAGWINRGMQEFKAARYPEAVAAFERAAAIDPSSVEAQLYLGSAYMEQFIPGAESPENLRIAETVQAHFMRALDLEPSNAVALASMAGLSLNQKKWDEAQQWYEKLIAVEPQNADAYYSIGWIAWSKWYPAYTKTRASLGMRPEEPGPIKDGGVRADLTARYGAVLESGVRAFEKALEINPQYDDAMAYMNLLIRERADLRDTAEEYKRDVMIADDLMKGLATKKNSVSPPPPPPPASSLPSRILRRFSERL